MPKEKLEDFSIEKLKIRKRLIVTVLSVVTIAVILDAATLVYLIIVKDLNDLAFLIPGLFCVFFVLYFYVGLKKINAELTKRSEA